MRTKQATSVRLKDCVGKKFLKMIEADQPILLFEDNLIVKLFSTSSEIFGDEVRDDVQIVDDHTLQWFGIITEEERLARQKKSLQNSARAQRRYKLQQYEQLKKELGK